MFIEVTYGEDGPRVYPIKNRILIGSSEPSDIIIPVQGVSRKHVVFLREVDKYYVIDQGSTNGTYVDEQRIRPGQRIEINPYLPVRLSRDVLFCVVEERQGKTGIFSHSKENLLSDSTRIISLSDLKEGTAITRLSDEKRQKLKTGLSKKKKVATAKKIEISDLLNLVIGVLICIVAYLAIKKRM